MSNHFEISHFDTGVAVPRFEHHLMPAELDSPAAAKAREAWQAANAAGEKLHADYRRAGKAWTEANPEHTFADRAAWIHALNMATRDLEADVKAATKKSVKALEAYMTEQRNGGAGLNDRATAKTLEADARIAEILKELLELFPKRAAYARAAGLASDEWRRDYRLAANSDGAPGLIAKLDVIRAKGIRR